MSPEILDQLEQLAIAEDERKNSAADSYIRGALLHAEPPKPPVSDEPLTFEGPFANVLYEVTISSVDPETKQRVMVDGMITVTHEDETIDGEPSPLGNSTAFAWYQPEGAVAVTASIADFHALRRFYAGENSPTLMTSPLSIHTFYEPFLPEAEADPLPPEGGERVYVSDDRLIYELMTTDIQARAEFPRKLEEDYPELLGGQGVLQLASDGAEVTIQRHEVKPLKKEVIPAKYPVSFSSLKRNR